MTKIRWELQCGPNRFLGDRNYTNSPSAFLNLYVIKKPTVWGFFPGSYTINRVCTHTQESNVMVLKDKVSKCLTQKRITCCEEHGYT